MYDRCSSCGGEGAERKWDGAEHVVCPCGYAEHVRDALAAEQASSRFTVVLIDAPPEQASEGDFAHVVGVTRRDLEEAAVGAPWLAGLAEAAADIARRDAREEIRGAAERTMQTAGIICDTPTARDLATVAAFTLSALRHEEEVPRG